MQSIGSVVIYNIEMHYQQISLKNSVRFCCFADLVSVAQCSDLVANLLQQCANIWEPYTDGAKKILSNKLLSWCYKACL